uniref:Uncharacterized protein n=1 Tax=Terrapene triunguis TaxID=2587831 RepID=A0A674I7M9_9SAUR
VNAAVLTHSARPAPCRERQPQMQCEFDAAGLRHPSPCPKLTVMMFSAYFYNSYKLYFYRYHCLDVALLSLIHTETFRRCFLYALG